MDGRRMMGGGQEQRSNETVGGESLLGGSIGDGAEVLMEQLSSSTTSHSTAVKRSAPSGVLEEDRSIATSMASPIIVVDEDDDRGDDSNHHYHPPAGLTHRQERTNRHSNNGRSDLDSRRNDNSFHVLAELLVELFLQDKQQQDCFIFEAKDRTTLQRILPESSVQPFIDAVRYRWEHLDKSTATSTALRQLVQQCHELRFDEAEPGDNPILALLQMPESAITLTIPIHPRRQPARKNEQVDHDDDDVDDPTDSNSDRSVAPDQEDTALLQREDSSTTAAAVDTPRTTSEQYDFRAVLAGSFSSKSDTGNNHNHHHNKMNINRQQTEQQRLSMEILEAKKLMNTSVEVETKHFWKSHMAHLQSQLQSFRPEPIVVEAEEAPVFPLDRKLSETHSRQSDTNNHRPMVDVVAPADLPAGYRFEAAIEGQRFIATVPHTGVQQGETFTCVMQELDSVAIDIPVGRWKDGSGDLCSLGCCHPTAWHAVFCPLILLSQIQTRLDLDFLGRPRFGNAPLTNRSLMFIVVTFWAMANVVLFTACNIKWSNGLELTIADWCAVVVVNLFMVAFVIFVTQSTRTSLREKYMIGEERCFDLEDLCCAVTCLPCSVAQMARHTANYNTYEAVCCSKTGLPNGVKVDKDLHGMNNCKDGCYAV